MIRRLLIALLALWSAIMIGLLGGSAGAAAQEVRLGATPINNYDGHGTSRPIAGAAIERSPPAEGLFTANTTYDRLTRRHAVDRQSNAASARSEARTASGYDRPTQPAQGARGTCTTPEWVRGAGRMPIALDPGGVAAKSADEGVEGGLNLFKWKDPTSTRPSGWREGDYMLHIPWKGTPKATWAENSSRLRSAMRSRNPIYESYVDSKGSYLPTTGFLNAERNILINRGWTYNPGAGAWFAP